MVNVSQALIGHFHSTQAPTEFHIPPWLQVPPPINQGSKIVFKIFPIPMSDILSPLILISKMNFNLYLVSHPNLLYSQYLLSQWMDSTNTKLPRIEIGTSLKALVSLTWSKCFFFFFTLVPSSMFQFVEGATFFHHSVLADAIQLRSYLLEYKLPVLTQFSRV